MCECVGLGVLDSVASVSHMFVVELPSLALSVCVCVCVCVCACVCVCVCAHVDTPRGHSVSQTAVW